ncbi:MAG: hypothetical protein ACRERE_06830, partial [Candidatus Entotheonellia bacterium]
MPECRRAVFSGFAAISSPCGLKEGDDRLFQSGWTPLRRGNDGESATWEALLAQMATAMAPETWIARVHGLADGDAKLI